jgi:hypothetical protein
MKKVICEKSKSGECNCADDCYHGEKHVEVFLFSYGVTCSEKEVMCLASESTCYGMAVKCIEESK